MLMNNKLIVYSYITPKIKLSTGNAMRKLLKVNNDKFTLNIDKSMLTIKNIVDEIYVRAKYTDKIGKTSLNTKELCDLNLLKFNSYFNFKTNDDRCQDLMNDLGILTDYESIANLYDVNVNIKDTVKNIENSDIVIINIPYYKATDYLVIMGYALGAGKKVYMYGDIKNVKYKTMFAKHENVKLFNTVNECMDDIVNK